ncbi:MAG TPA: hypothetical protein PKH77_08395 [Anaerolineae bacterium]|nr:hypothetical protein [Anaerolineae bacterium]
MRDPMQLLNLDWHSEEWWERAFEDDISVQEARLWEKHLVQCAECRREWEALRQLDTILRTAPPAPMLDASFTTRTVTRAVQKQHLRSLLSFLGSAFIIALVAWVVLNFLGNAYVSLGHALHVVRSEWQLLFTSLLQTVLALFTGWKIILPFLLGLAALSFLLLMPNGVLATLLFLWLSRRRPAALAVMN